MAEYLHGAYGNINAVGAEVSDKSQTAIVYIGTAPVNQVEEAGEGFNVNTPLVVNNIAEARKYLGYSDNWGTYTLCEAMYMHFVKNTVGPIVLINVLDPEKHAYENGNTYHLTPSNGRVVIPSGDTIIMDSITVKAGSKTFSKYEDYEAVYNFDKKTVTIKERKAGALGTEQLTIEYKCIDPNKVSAEDVIGAATEIGKNTGVNVIQDVYTKTGYIPAFIAAPGFSSIPEVHKALSKNSLKINGHWDAFMFTDLPIVSGEETLTFEKAYEYKVANGYCCENEKVCYPMVECDDFKTYHLSVIAAANFQKLLKENDGIPFHSSSNTEIAGAVNLYLGNDYSDRTYGDSIVNEYLNKNGIASAAYMGGRWALWGAHCADYDQNNSSETNMSETTRMMLYYISNDFQVRRMQDVDRPMTVNDLKTIASEEQARLDALINIGSLTYGTVSLDAVSTDESDVLNGDYSFTFNITTTPLAKSLTAVVNWTNEGFKSYFEEE
ncbi:MAG: hypothetical protein Q4B26_03185 [Eubacteriales bacterium]|nr:hypothetical protein [Eubacteriales bacterium]